MGNMQRSSRVWPIYGSQEVVKNQISVYSHTKTLAPWVRCLTTVPPSSSHAQPEAAENGVFYIALSSTANREKF